MEHTFSTGSTGKFLGIIGILKRQSCFSVGRFLVKKHDPFTSFHKESPAVPAYSRRYLSQHLEFWRRKHKRMELVSNGTHSSLDGPFHGSFRKFLVNGKRPWTLVIADNRHLIIAQPRHSRRKPTSLMRARLSHLRTVLRLSFLFGRRSNRVIEFACFDSKLQQARNTCERKKSQVYKPSDASLFQAFRQWRAVRSKDSDKKQRGTLFYFFRAPFYFAPLPTI